MSFAGRLAFAVALVACGKSTEQGGSAAVRDYFAAMSQKDCTALRELSGGKVAANYDKVGCSKLLESYAEMGLQLVDIQSEVEDGRNSNARIVRATIAFDKGPREVLLRVERSSGRWVLVSL